MLLLLWGFGVLLVRVPNSPGSTRIVSKHGNFGFRGFVPFLRCLGYKAGVWNVKDCVFEHVRIVHLIPFIRLSE